MDLITSNLGDEIKRILNDNEIIKMSVVIAFITKEGAKKFLEWVEMCHEKKSIRIILSTYLDFTSPNAIKILNNSKNISVRVFPMEKGNLHAKAYIFESNKEANIIVGSSNLTKNALEKNVEWNIKRNEDLNSKLFIDIKKEFEKLWSSSIEINDKWIRDYND